MKKTKKSLVPKQGRSNHIHHPDRTPDHNPPPVHKKNVNEREIEKLFVEPVVNPNKP